MGWHRTLLRPGTVGCWWTSTGVWILRRWTIKEKCCVCNDAYDWVRVSLVQTRVAALYCFDYSAIHSASNAKNPFAQRFFFFFFFFFVVAQFGTIWRFFRGSNLFCLCVESIAIVHHAGIMNEFSSTHAKFQIKAVQHKRIFDAHKWTLRSQFLHCQCTIMRPKLPRTVIQTQGGKCDVGCADVHLCYITTFMYIFNNVIQIIVSYNIPK